MGTLRFREPQVFTFSLVIGYPGSSKIFNRLKINNLTTQDKAQARGWVIAFSVGRKNADTELKR
jgi:hypothetical protein